MVDNVDQYFSLEWSGVQYDPLEKEDRILRAGPDKNLVVRST